MRPRGQTAEWYAEQGARMRRHGDATWERIRFLLAIAPHTVDELAARVGRTSVAVRTHIRRHRDELRPAGWRGAAGLWALQG